MENEFAEHVQFHQQGSKMVRSQEIGPADQVQREANEDGGEAGLGSPLPSRDPDGGRQKQVVDKHGRVGPAKK